MYKFFKAFMLIITLASSSFYSLSLSAASAPDPRSKPEVFTDANPSPSSNPTYHPYIGAFKAFLQSTGEGQAFIKEVLNGNINGMPIGFPAFRSDNVVDKYRDWYNLKFAAPSQAALVAATAQATAAAQAKIDVVEAARQRAEAARQRAEAAVAVADTQLAVVKKETVGLRSQVENQAANMGAILAGGGSRFSSAAVNDLVTRIGAAAEIEVDNVTFDDDTNTFGFEGRINNEPVKMTIPTMDPAEYNRLKIILAMVQKMHSKAYNAASGAMGDLVTDILSSAQPQDYHFKQIAHLASTSSKLDGYLKYHGEQSKNLNDWHALPLKDFLRIKFLPPIEVERAREGVMREFTEIKDKIPDVNGLPFGSQAVDKFLKKIHSSIVLPTETEFSQQEIEETFKELGLLLEIDQSDEIVIDSDYFSKLCEVSKSVKSLKKMAKAKLDQGFESSKYKRLFEEKEREIADGSRIPTPGDFFDNLTDLNDQNTLIGSRGAKKLFDELATLVSAPLVPAPPVPAVPNMPYQDAGLATAAIRAGGANIVPIRAVIFLIQKFAIPEQFAAVMRRSIIGELDPAIQAALSSYYGAPMNIIKQELLDLKMLRL